MRSGSEHSRYYLPLPESESIGFQGRFLAGCTSYIIETSNAEVITGLGFEGIGVRGDCRKFVSEGTIFIYLLSMVSSRYKVLTGELAAYLLKCSELLTSFWLVWVGLDAGHHETSM